MDLNFVEILQAAHQPLLINFNTFCDKQKVV